MTYHQQGDVLLTALATVSTTAPVGARKLSHTRLAEGEATGHAHVAVGEAVVLYEDASGTLFLHAPEGCEVVHEEHGTITLPAGDYAVGRVQEYDHFEEEARAVRD